MPLKIDLKLPTYYDFEKGWKKGFGGYTSGGFFEHSSGGLFGGVMGILDTATGGAFQFDYNVDKEDKKDTSSPVDPGSEPPPASTIEESTEMETSEKERERMDAIRRMLAGRYGRAETNLTMGRSYGSGSGRSLTGMS